MNDRKRQVRWIALLVCTALALYGCWRVLQPFVGIITWATVFVVTFLPVHRRILAWIGRPGMSALASSALVVVIVFAPLVFVGAMMVREVPALSHNARDALTKAIGPESPLAGQPLEWLSQFVDLEELRSPEFFKEWAQRIGGKVALPLLGAVNGFLGFAIQAFLTLFTIFYLFRDGEGIASWLKQTLPLEEVQNAEIFRRTREMIEASVFSVVVLAVIQGTLGGLAFLVLGLPNPFVWGVVMTILSTIPVAGSFVVWVPAAIFLAATGHWGSAMLLVAWGVLVIGMVDNFLRPVIMGQKARMHELLLFFAVLGGLAVFGVDGLILGPVVVAVALGLLDVIRQTDRPAEAIRREPGLAGRRMSSA